jgi:transcription initiation factor IIE alpha subunit
VTTAEPRFTELDRAELFALAMHRESLCPACGKPLEVCTSMEGEGPDFRVEYTACRATLAKLEKQRGLFGDDKKPDPNAPSYLWAVHTVRR